MSYITNIRRNDFFFHLISSYFLFKSSLNFPPITVVHISTIIIPRIFLEFYRIHLHFESLLPRSLIFNMYFRITAMYNVVYNRTTDARYTECNVTLSTREAKLNVYRCYNAEC